MVVVGVASLKFPCSQWRHVMCPHWSPGAGDNGALLSPCETVCNIAEIYFLVGIFAAINTF